MVINTHQDVCIQYLKQHNVQTMHHDMKNCFSTEGSYQKTSGKRQRLIYTRAENISGFFGAQVRLNEDLLHSTITYIPIHEPILPTYTATTTIHTKYIIKTEREK